MPMTFSDRYPLIVTRHKDACRDFWLDKLGFEAGFDSSWFCWLQAPDGSASIAFMTPDHPSAPPGPQEFSGQGVCFELQVDDVDAAYAQACERALPVSYPLTNETFGQRRFGFSDPSGLWVDVVQQTEPAIGYWDRFARVG
jgi:catechol 2,3-dioxygenase-like lactoylglutathione lyase family enzyme